jgi:superfamily II DNA or RNA helicase
MNTDKNILSKEGYLIHKKKNKNIIEHIKEELTVTPYLPFNKNIKPESFPVFLENEKYLCVPKYYGIQKFGKPDTNKELCGSNVNIIFSGKLRSNQLDIVNIVLNKMETNDGGLLSLGCGQGKTVLSLYIASILKVKTLVIVHKSFLLNQWIQRAKEFTNANIGIIQQNKIDIDGKEIVIGMLQSISKDKYDSDIFRDFGLVIFDEAHHAPSKYFSKALPIIACRKTLALSATPNRADKLEKVLYWYFGDILYKAPTETINNVLVKLIKYNIKDPNFREYKQNYGQDINRPKTINKLIQIAKRNTFIISNIKEILEEDQRKLLVLSDRIEHLTILKDLLQFEVSTSFYIGGLKQKVLDEAEKAQVIFATYSMAAEALDIPELNTLFMVTPRKEVEQAVGRITRKKDHPVQPLIFDFVDQLPSFARQSSYRRKFYNKKGFIIKLIEVEENEIINETNEININEEESELFID